MSPIILVALSALMVLYVCHVQGQSSCATPSGAVGSCISLYECSELMTLVSKPNKSQQDLQLLKQSHCGFDRNVPKVCCPVQSTTTESLLRQGNQDNDSCFTADGQQGRCAGIYSCQHLADMLTPPVSNDTIAFLQKLRCNSPELYSVCCTPPPAPTPAPVANGVCTVTAEPPDPISKCCGRESKAIDKITGGTATAVDEYPWLVLIEYVRNNRITLSCGGALISGRYVLTAGHCVVGKDPTNVRLGEYDRSNEGPDCVRMPGGGEDCTNGITVIPIEKVIAHPQYDPDDSQRRNDIALLRLSQLAPYTDFIHPICLPTTDIPASFPLENPFYVAGWGAVNGTVRQSQKKLHVDLPYVPQAACQPAYRVQGRNVTLWQGQLCAGGEANKDSCKGDSGGPLMYIKLQHYEVVGIVSFGDKHCGTENVPGVYTKVYEYKSWISSQIRP